MVTAAVAAASSAAACPPSAAPWPPPPPATPPVVPPELPSHGLGFALHAPDQVGGGFGADQLTLQALQLPQYLQALQLGAWSAAPSPLMEAHVAAAVAASAAAEASAVAATAALVGHRIAPDPATWAAPLQSLWPPQGVPPTGGFVGADFGADLGTMEKKLDRLLSLFDREVASDPAAANRWAAAFALVQQQQEQEAIQRHQQHLRERLREPLRYSFPTELL